ncbi:hypothetical protein [Kineococcus sp. SYSU DK018]|uniref:hypothetical protein n=1 Tax=Kineococcus sp. SYSU DK018 TaxID=3383139 RepID=UPI003D7D3903
MKLGASITAALSRGPLLTPHEKAVARRRAFSISAYVGPNGAGKSLLMAGDTLPTLKGIPWACTNPDHLHTQAGVTTGLRRVLSTMRFTSPDGSDHPLWDPLDDYAKIVRAEHVDLILDEVGGAVGSSSGGDDLPMAVKASLQELRRRDVFCRWTAPSWARASKVLRECSQGVTLVLGFMPVAHKDGISFDGTHPMWELSEDGRRVVEKTCRMLGEHSHDAGRLWGAKRLMFARTFDANVFDEWTTAKREKVKPEVRELFWRPGSTAESAYDTHAYVEKLGQVTDTGICLDCSGTRRRKACECESPTTRRRRVRALADPEVGPPAAAAS